MAPQGLCLDKAYDHNFVRELLEEARYTPHIRSRGEEARQLREDVGERARRWVVERVHSWINRYRGLLIRWSKKSRNHEALLAFCFALITCNRWASRDNGTGSKTRRLCATRCSRRR